MVPIPGVTQVAFHFVEDGVEPGGGGVGFVLLDEFVSGVPIAGEGEVDGAEEVGFGGGHVEDFSG